MHLCPWSRPTLTITTEYAEILYTNILVYTNTVLYRRTIKLSSPGGMAGLMLCIFAKIHACRNKEQIEREKVSALSVI